jgi:hypothetical protein
MQAWDGVQRPPSTAGVNGHGVAARLPAVCCVSRCPPGIFAAMALAAGAEPPGSDDITRPGLLQV